MSLRQEMIKKEHPQPDDTRPLITGSMKGDRSSQYALYKKYSKAMYNICYRIVNDQEEARDVLQETFISAFQHMGAFRGESSFGAWLKKIAVNQAINHLRKRKMLYESVDDIEYSDEENSPDEENLALNVERVREAIQQLPDGFRTVFSLYLLEGYDHSEIARIMSISESTSKTQYIRAKNKLKTILKERIS